MINNTPISEEVLKTIDKTDIKPINKLYFIFKNYLVWVLFVFSVVIGSLAVSVVLLLIVNNNMPIHEIGFLQAVLLSIPYFWLVLMIAFVVVAFYNLKNTKKGYKYNSILIIVACVFLSFIFGSIIFGFGGGLKLENFVYERIPFYQNIMRLQGKPLCNPEAGRLAGVFLQPIDESSFELEDCFGDNWEIHWNKPLPCAPGCRMKIAGKAQSENRFSAEEIMPLLQKFQPFYKVKEIVH